MSGRVENARRCVGFRVTWRRRIGVVSVEWYGPSRPRMARLIGMVHLPLTEAAEAKR